MEESTRKRKKIKDYKEVYFPNIKEQLAEVRHAFHIYNNRLDKRAKEKKELDASLNVNLNTIFEKYESARNYIENTVIPKINRLKENDVYEVKYIDNYSSPNSREVEQYFKVIIKHKILQKERFILVNINVKEFIITLTSLEKDPSADEFITIKVPVKKFNKTYMRNVFLNYLIDVINNDTVTSKKLI